MFLGTWQKSHLLPGQRVSRTHSGNTYNTVEEADESLIFHQAPCPVLVLITGDASEQRYLLLIRVFVLFYEKDLLRTNYLNVEGADRRFGEQRLGRLGEPAAGERRGDAEEALDAGEGQSDEDEVVLVLLLVHRAVGRLVDETQAQQLDADDRRDE